MKFFKRGLRRKRRRRILILLVGLPLLGWAALNLIFLTPLARGAIAGPISERIGLECEIDGLTWTPWSGLTVSGVRVRAPRESRQVENLVEVDHLSVDPSWWSLLSGKRRWERLEVSGVRVELSVEALRGILAQFERPQPPLGGGERPDRRSLQTEASREEKEVKPDPKPSDQREGGPPRRDTEIEGPVESRPSDDFEGVVVFSDLNLRLYSQRVPELAVAVTGVAGEIPVWGAPRAGHFAFEELALGNDLSEKEVTFEVSWQDQSVRLDSGVMKFFGLDLRVRGLIRMAPGYPFGLRVDVPPQDVDFSPVYQSRQSPLEVHGLVSRNVLQGYLTTPSSFSGSHFSEFKEVIFHDLSDGGEARFERGRASVLVSGGGVVARDFRVLGEEDALLMNGFATFGGEAATTLRVVASPERAQSHENRVRRADETWTLDFQPLITPDRMFRDLRLEWREGEVMIDLAGERGWVPFWPAMQKVLGRRNSTFSTKPYLPPKKS